MFGNQKSGHFRIHATKLAVHDIAQGDAQAVADPLSELQSGIGFAGFYVADSRDVDAELAREILACLPWRS